MKYLVLPGLILSFVLGYCVSENKGHLIGWFNYKQERSIQGCEINLHQAYMDKVVAEQSAQDCDDIKESLKNINNLMP